MEKQTICTVEALFIKKLSTAFRIEINHTSLQRSSIFVISASPAS